MADRSDRSEPSEAEETSTQTADTASESATASSREVVVPLSLYKVITVFSTLIAGSSVVAGFMVLDTATQRASAPPEEIDPILSLLGLFLIAAGGGIYAFSGRFRAPGMGTPKPEDREDSADG